MSSGARQRSGLVGRGWAVLMLALVLAGTCGVRVPETRAASGATLDDSLDAAESEGREPRRKLTRWNAYEGPYVTVRFGAGLLYDIAAYAQDEDSERQVHLHDDDAVRDARFLFKGGFPTFPRLSYTLGYMYDARVKTWHFRQTGLMFAVPELYGQLFVGRTKEGTSTNKLMVGYHGWTNERATANDAFHPILADGVKWMGRTPKGTVVYSLGGFGDEFSEKESFNRFDYQFVARAIWLPLLETDPENLLHVGGAYRFAKSNDGHLQFKSKPESFLAQTNVIDTGKFRAANVHTIGLETYWRPGPFTMGMEYFLNQVHSDETNHPFFHGGEIFASYILTGETRPYNTRGAFFEAVSPEHPLFEGGLGAWELVGRFSYTDLDSGPIEGGKFWRITPVLNWYLSDNVRLEAVYGYGMLDRFGDVGGTHFFQGRIQLTL
jgi:phosphate-selective porin OprO/OprP